MRGTEYLKAVRAIRKVDDLTYFKSETVHRAVGAVLAYVGARRLQAACAGDPDGAGDRRLLGILTDVEGLAVRLASIPLRVERGVERGEVWSQIVGHLARVRVLLEQERRTARVAARVAQVA